jgi:hypothetical protein
MTEKVFKILLQSFTKLYSNVQQFSFPENGEVSRYVQTEIMYLHIKAFEDKYDKNLRIKMLAHNLLSSKHQLCMLMNKKITIESILCLVK